jgi:hypothetical protein
MADEYGSSILAWRTQEVDGRITVQPVNACATRFVGLIGEPVPGQGAAGIGVQFQGKIRPHVSSTRI